MDFKWLNQGEINIEDDRIEMVAPPQSDFFCNNGAVSEVGMAMEKTESQSPGRIGTSGSYSIMCETFLFRNLMGL